MHIEGLVNRKDNISPVDSRYYAQTQFLSKYFSEYSLTKRKLYVELEYLIAIQERVSNPLTLAESTIIRNIHKNFDEKEYERLLQVESILNHDVKALEYYIKSKDVKGKNFIHFALTSQDINNTAIPLAFKEYMEKEYYKALDKLISFLDEVTKFEIVPMLSRTHGQIATPTTLDKELYVFVHRLNQVIKNLRSIPHTGKFSGSIGNFNAHYAAYRNINWYDFADGFLKYLGLERQLYTTQVENYDNLCSFFDGMRRVNTILLDLCRDIWLYISMDYLKLKIVDYEVGSSTMPHKVNPIDFENAEGNLGIANALFSHFSEKLPISRLQRDLSDSTVLRNIAVPLAHTHIAINSIIKGLQKLSVNKEVIDKELDKNWQVLAEPIQTILKREGYIEAYEDMRRYTRGNKLSKKDIHRIIDNFAVEENIKEELKKLTPHKYI
jgi:adenylosuccinate lyase